MTPTLNQDWIELLESLNRHSVDYIMVGAFAVAYHGFPRYTGDIDIFVSPSLSNARRLHCALIEFGAPVTNLAPDSLAEPGVMITFGNPPHRVDILNWLSGLDWEDAFSDAIPAQLAHVDVRFLSIRALRKNKSATNRPQDRADLSRLPEA